MNQVDLELNAGEVLALIGENGAGKSTLIRILGGIYPPDEGEIRIDERRVEVSNVRDAMRLGISIIHQELNLSDNLNIAENIYLGRQPSRAGWLQVTNKRLMHRQAAALLARVGLNISTGTLVDHLSIGQKQMIEIAKALSLDARVIVFDEPTSSLSIQESEKLFEVVDSLRASGLGVIYITHRLFEVRRLANRVMVLRDGRCVGELSQAEIEYQRMVSMMVGRDVQQYYHHSRHDVRAGSVLEVRDLSYPGARKPISFTIRHGEIVGFAGLVGAGRTELARALFGIDSVDSGWIRVQNRKLNLGSPRRAVDAGLLLVPEERKTQGLVLDMSLLANVSMACLSRLAPAGLMNRKAERELTQRQIKRLSIRAASPRQPVMFLSGGNQQKVVLAKWLSLDPAVMILDEPTRGVDVGAKSEIYGLISELAARGVGILLISSEMEEVIAMSDRIIVMHNGEITGELSGDTITEENILTLAIGSQPS